MSQHNADQENTGDAKPQAPQPELWRITLAWPEVTAQGRQERVDGLQQLLSTRAIVGLMGPGRPTRGGLVVDLVLPTRDGKLLKAVQGGGLETGASDEDFADDVHRFTGAVVVNGDLSSAEFEVLAADESLTDAQIEALLVEPIQSLLLLGTSAESTVREAAERAELDGLLLAGERPIAAIAAPDEDPTTLVMPGESPRSIALKERPGRVDLTIWGAPSDADAQPTRRRRAQRSPLIEVVLGAVRQPVVLPEAVRPADSEVATLLATLVEDDRAIDAAQLEALAALVGKDSADAVLGVAETAPTRGVDLEAGVAAPMRDGLLPGEVDEEAEAAASLPSHATVRELLAALGEDASLADLLDGKAPSKTVAETFGTPDFSAAARVSPDAEPATTEIDVATKDAQAAASKDAGEVAEEGESVKDSDVSGKDTDVPVGDSVATSTAVVGEAVDGAEPGQPEALAAQQANTDAESDVDEYADDEAGEAADSDEAPSASAKDADAAAEDKTDAGADVDAKADPEAAAESDQDAKRAADAKPEPDGEGEAQPDADADADATSEVTSDAKPEGDEKPEDGAKPEGDAKPEDGEKPEDDAKATPDAKPEGEPTAEAEETPPSAVPGEDEPSFDELLAGGPVAAESAASVAEQKTSTAAESGVDTPTPLPVPTPAASTPLATEQFETTPRRTWPIVFVVLGALIIVAAAVFGFMAPSVLQFAAVSTGWVIAGLAGVVGLGLLIVGVVGQSRR